MKNKELTAIKENLKNLPKTFGIYFFSDSNGKIIYVGKAKSIKNRVTSYFSSKKNQSPKTDILVSKINNVDFIVTKNEMDALILESNLIKKHKPKYNIVLRDDKHYPYLRVATNEDFPYITISRKVLADGAKYFGPYTPSFALKAMLDELYRVFPLRRSKDPIKDNLIRRPCLNFQIKKCLAPCAGYISKEDYNDLVKGALLFLKGSNSDLIKSLTLRMKNASSKLLFEEASKFRDQIISLKKIMHKQHIISNKSIDQDIISFYTENKEFLLFNIMFIRHGKLTGKRELKVEFKNDNHNKTLHEFLTQYYLANEYIPDNIIVRDDPTDKELIEQLLTNRKHKTVKITAPKRGRSLSLLNLSEDNAKISYKKINFENNENLQIIKNLKELLNLKKLPKHIEGFDISNIQGKMAVGSMVVFKDARSVNRLYRNFKIKTGDTPDDYRMTGEIIERRYKRLISENKDLPDLILIDGGVGQLNIALRVLEKLNIKTIDIVSISKGKDRNNIYTDKIITRSGEIKIEENKHLEARMLLQRVRDEAHRFAINYHRKLRSLTITSELDSIIGIGKKLKLNLLRHFESTKEIKKVSIKEIMKVNGINQKKAQTIYDHFKKGNKKEGDLKKLKMVKL